MHTYPFILEPFCCFNLKTRFLTMGCCCSVAQSCPTLCDPMDCTPGFPVLPHLPELAQTPVHWDSDAVQPPHPLDGWINFWQRLTDSFPPNSCRCLISPAVNESDCLPPFLSQYVLNAFNFVIWLNEMSCHMLQLHFDEQQWSWTYFHVFIGHLHLLWIASLCLTSYFVELFVFFVLFFVLVKVKIPQSCPALCSPVDYTVHGILQARNWSG